MTGRQDVCVLIPTLDEAATIGTVIDQFHDAGYDHILVMDGGSTDDTRTIAETRGARVRTQTGTGKGQAIREALRHIDTPIVLMIDGDGTYLPEQADHLIDPLRNGRAEHVIGNRFADMQPGAMTRLNRIGNRIINAAFGLIHAQDYQDILSGYRAFTLESARQSLLTADGFGIETELAVECAKHNTPTTAVPITYRPRPGASEPNLRPFRDGATIILTVYRLAKTNNPLFYFGSAGALSGLIGTLLGGYVGYRWFAFGISHEVLAILAAFAVLFGVQLVMFGVLSDMILALHRAQMRRLE